MANNFTMNVSEDFNLEEMANEVEEQYQAKGFNVRVFKMKKGVKIKFDKKCGGINMLLGLGLGITATCTLSGKEGDVLSVNYSDGDWTGKIIGCVIGWCLCMIPFVTAIIGIIKQSSLPSEISDTIQVLASE